LSRRRVGIVGLGQIGGGLADLLADRGVPITVYVRRPEAAEVFRAGVRRRLERRRERARLADSTVADLPEQIRIARDFADFRDVDIALEAISEDITAKRSILSELARACPDRAILASTTSELSLDALAEGLPDTARMIGAHFLSPVRLTTVVEVIRTPRSAPWAVAEMAAWCRTLGKRPFVFRRSVVNRLLASYIAEGLSLCVATGLSPEVLDARMLDAGMMMGPLSTLDLVGLDVAVDVFSGSGSSLVARDDVALRIIETLRAEGHLGRKSKSGIFLYPDKGRGANPRLLALLAESGDGLRRRDGEDIVERVWLRLIDEYLCCVTHELGDPDEIDAVLREVLGIDQGPLHRLRNLDPAILQPRLATVEQSLGSRYRPTRDLLERVRGNDG
jgi:3-hydroxyacyl-CoA dehydrogenase/enoyl-CoA hydratase/3-hydroxybutyryl-CoA epimerase